jgi:CTP:molybdopterin cytidylyltransferase MocA
MYICNSCFEELLAFKKNWPSRMSVLEMRHRIEDFMRTPPGNYVEVNTDEEFEKLTGIDH